MIMGKIKKDYKVRIICGILLNPHWCKARFNLSDSLEVISYVNSKLEQEFSQLGLEKVHSQSEIIKFDFSNYYNEEMGEDILRYWISFSPLIQPKHLYEFKLLSNKIEETHFSDEQSKRKVNIDPGYIDGSKVVLFSTKNYSHRIYLDEGVFAEVTLIYKNKQFKILEWTYPDYKTIQALNFFSEIRKDTI